MPICQGLFGSDNGRGLLSQGYTNATQFTTDYGVVSKSTRVVCKNRQPICPRTRAYDHDPIGWMPLSSISDGRWNGTITKINQQQPVVLNNLPRIMLPQSIVTTTREEWCDYYVASL